MVSKNVRVARSIVFAIVVSTAACAHNSGGSSATSPSAPIVDPAAVVNGSWTLQSLTRPDSSTVSITEPGQFTLQLGEDNRVTLRIDCNRGTGSYTLAASTLTIGPLATTKAYCASAPLDNEYLLVLGGQSVVTATQSSLEVSSPRGTLRFGK